MGYFQEYSSPSWSMASPSYWWKALRGKSAVGGWDYLESRELSHCMETAIISSSLSDLSRRSELWHGHKNIYNTLNQVTPKWLAQAHSEDWKWKVADAGRQAKSHLQNKVLMGKVVQGRGDLGSVTGAHYDTTSRKEKQRLLQEEVGWAETPKAEAESLPCGSAYLSTGLDDDSWLAKAAENPTAHHPNLRPHITMILETTKQLILLELTLPWEGRMVVAQERKQAKFLEQVEDCHRKVWRSRCMPIKVGCMGFILRDWSEVPWALLG